MTNFLHEHPSKLWPCSHTEGWIILKLDLVGINADSLVQMLKASFTLENWDGILQVADQLYNEINKYYEINQRERADGKEISTFGLNRSIVYYFGYSMSLMGIALEKMGRYDEARACITKYGELGWINGWLPMAGLRWNTIARLLGPTDMLSNWMKVTC